MRDVYVERGFLAEVYDQDEIQIRSTFTPRTIETAQALMLGLYPEGFRKENGVGSGAGLIFFR